MIEHGPSGLSIVGEDYESVEFQISSQTDYNVKTQQSFFARVKKANHVFIRTDQTITVKLVKANGVTGDAITVDPSLYLQSNQMLTSNILITTTTTTNIKILIS